MPISQHPGFIDLNRETLAGAVVTGRAKNTRTKGLACWNVRIVKCGHNRVIRGTQLREIANAGRTVRCAQCTAARKAAALDRVREREARAEAGHA